MWGSGPREQKHGGVCRMRWRQQGRSNGCEATQCRMPCTRPYAPRLLIGPHLTCTLPCGSRSCSSSPRMPGGSWANTCAGGTRAGARRRRERQAGQDGIPLLRLAAKPGKASGGMHMHQPIQANASQLPAKKAQLLRRAPPTSADSGVRLAAISASSTADRPCASSSFSSASGVGRGTGRAQRGG